MISPSGLDFHSSNFLIQGQDDLIHRPNSNCTNTKNYKLESLNILSCSPKIANFHSNSHIKLIDENPQKFSPYKDVNIKSQKKLTELKNKSKLKNEAQGFSTNRSNYEKFEIFDRLYQQKSNCTKEATPVYYKKKDGRTRKKKNK